MNWFGLKSACSPEPETYHALTWDSEVPAVLLRDTYCSQEWICCPCVLAEPIQHECSHTGLAATKLLWPQLGSQAARQDRPNHLAP